MSAAHAADPLTTSPTVPVDEVVATRRGEVLIKSTILKSDHFPGCQNKKLLPLLDGAPNFRQVPGLPVYGVAIPTVAGVKRVLDVLGAQQGKRPVKWFNMREEPVLYINGNPYVVREASKPFANLEITGIDRSRVEDMENRLRADVLREAEQYDGQVLLAHENDDFQVIEEWEPVTKANVQTPLDVYKCLNEEGYSLEYLRVPVTDEKAPKERDFVVLQRRIWDKPPDTALIFNCQMGRGRTTTGMIIGSLLLLRQHTSSLPFASQEGLPLWFAKSEAAATPNLPATSGDELKDGKYGVVRSLLRVLEGGTTSKEIVDHVIDACSAMQNLREAITGYRSRLTHESHEDKRNALLHVCLEYLERYYVLISYAAYLFDPNFDPDNPEQPSFGQWIKNRPELRSVLQRMLRRNPLAALALHRPTRAPEGGAMPPLLEDGASPRPSKPQRSSSLNRPEGASDDEDAEAEDETASLIAHRTGMVLGAHTILKEDHFPGCQSPKLPEVVQGAPNFRGARGFNVYGSALPTVDGIRRTLQQARALWYNMREEPVIYINGRPFVLREEERPFKNMQEYTGIDARRLEQMESRLKADVLREMTGFGGRVLVAHETSGQTGSGIMRGSIVDEFEDTSGPESIQTPREVYEALRADGYKCDYYRVPLTDGTAPKEVAFDTFYQHVKHAAPHDPVIFNCQMGAGRTTTGMVIACLIRMYTIGTQMHEPAAVQSHIHRGKELLQCWQGHTKHTAPFVDLSIAECFLAVRITFEAYDGVYLTERFSRGDGRMPNVEDIMGADNQCAGMSPRSAASDDIAGGSPGNSDDEAGENLNDRHQRQPSTLSDSMHTDDGNPAEVESLRDGDYVAVRRFVRILERGDDAKGVLDAVVDQCGSLINLRTAIMRYRKPKRWFTFYRPEINVRHSAFKRASAYLERYCLLLAFAAFLERNWQTGHNISFREWMSARPDVCQARDLIHRNPVDALAPVAAASFPPRLLLTERQNSREVEVTEQQAVLARRRGSTLSRRSILKGYLPQASTKHTAMVVEGVTDIRHARGLPVYTIGTASVQGTRNLLSKLGARPGGPSHVIVSDLREELVAYVSGQPYLRRELEMPSAALHHAGIQAAKLEDLERRLRADILNEASANSGRVLCHREQPHPQSAQGPSAMSTTSSSSSLASISRPSRRPGRANGSSGPPLLGQRRPQQTPASPLGRPPASDEPDPALPPSAEASGSDADDEEPAKPSPPLRQGSDVSEDITQKEDVQPDERVTAFWETIGDTNSLDHGVATPLEVYQGLVAEGYQLSYRRLPLSRERTPVAADLDALNTQLMVQPEDQQVVHLIVARTAAGSSARFVAAFACMFLGETKSAQQMSSSSSGALTDLLFSEPPSPMNSLGPARSRLMRHSTGGAVRTPHSWLEDEHVVERTASLMGEYRGIMNLCRVLPKGTLSKLAVDDAIDRCTPQIGNIREDIRKCKEIAETRVSSPTRLSPGPLGGISPFNRLAGHSVAAAARALGLHYLHRYFYLVTFACYLDMPSSRTTSFARWMSERRELKHLLHNLSLEVAT